VAWIGSLAGWRRLEASAPAGACCDPAGERAPPWAVAGGPPGRRRRQ